MKRHLAAIGAITAISAAGFTGASMVSAASTTDSSDPMSSLVDAMASKFNLDKTQVQAVFDEQKSAMQAEREAEMKTKIAQLVTDGKLTTVSIRPETAPVYSTCAGPALTITRAGRSSRSPSV